jgi:hypothetical protein
LDVRRFHNFEELFVALYRYHRKWKLEGTSYEKCAYHTSSKIDTVTSFEITRDSNRMISAA